MELCMQRQTLEMIDAALRAVIDEYAAADYADGDPHSVRLCRAALAAIESNLSEHVGVEDFVDGHRLMTICIGCGAKWELTEEIDEQGHVCGVYWLIEAGDGSCA